MSILMNLTIIKGKNGQSSQKFRFPWSWDMHECHLIKKPEKLKNKFFRFFDPHGCQLIDLMLKITHLYSLGKMSRIQMNTCKQWKCCYNGNHIYKSTNTCVAANFNCLFHVMEWNTQKKMGRLSQLLCVGPRGLSHLDRCHSKYVKPKAKGRGKADFCLAINDWQAFSLNHFHNVSPKRFGYFW